MSHPTYEGTGEPILIGDTVYSHEDRGPGGFLWDAQVVGIFASGEVELDNGVGHWRHDGTYLRKAQP